MSEALKLACRFSLPPNSLGYCGRDSAPEKFKKCVVEGVCSDVEKELEKFIVLNPYLETLAKVTGKPKFSREVVEAYWLGNDELKKAKPEDYSILLDNFIKQGVPVWFVDELRARPPKKFIPVHLFQVLHVGVGRASGSVPFNLESVNNCMIRWGKVTQILADKLTVTLFSLDGQIADAVPSNIHLIEEEVVVGYQKSFLSGLGIGDTVAAHWHQAVKILEPQEVDKLSYWTKEVIKQFS